MTRTRLLKTGITRVVASKDSGQMSVLSAPRPLDQELQLGVGELSVSVPLKHRPAVGPSPA
jgi:hypothetical protein